MSGTALTLDKMRAAVKLLRQQPKISWHIGRAVDKDGKHHMVLYDENGKPHPYAHPLPVWPALPALKSDQT